jgi:hypothetical protein
MRGCPVRRSPAAPDPTHPWMRFNLLTGVRFRSGPPFTLQVALYGKSALLAHRVRALTGYRGGGRRICTVAHRTGRLSVAQRDCVAFGPIEGRSRSLPYWARSPRESQYQGVHALQGRDNTTVSSPPEIYHVTLQTGHTSRFSRARVLPPLLTLVVPWLNRAIATGSLTPLPGYLRHYSGKARAGGQSEALLVHLFAPGGPHLNEKSQYGGLIPLVTLGVAQLPQHGQTLWEMLCEQATPLHPGVKKPTEPWLAVNIHPTIIHDVDTTGWLTDFEQSLAWAWITQHPALEVVGLSEGTADGDKRNTP